MDNFSRFNLENIRDLERIYILISSAFTNNLKYLDTKIDEKIIYLLKYIFPTITIEKLDVETYRIHLVKKYEYNFQDINYII